MAKKSGKLIDVVRYRSAIKDIVHDGVPQKELVWRSHKVDVHFMKRFKSAVFILYGVTGCARDLIDWLPLEVDERNMFSNTAKTRQKFMDFIHTCNHKKAYQENTVREAIKELKAAEMILSKKKPDYVLNPEYFFDKDHEARLEAIAVELEFKANVDTRLKITPKERREMYDKTDKPDVEDPYGKFSIGDKIKTPTGLIVYICNIFEDNICWWENEKLTGCHKSNVVII